MTQSPDPKESNSRLGVAFAISMAMIATTYLASAFNHQLDRNSNEHTYSQRPVVVGYLA